MRESLDMVFARLDNALSQVPNARLRDCSLSLGIDRQTVSKAVKATTGVSFREYQKQKILIEALRVLAEEGDLSDREIAGRFGYKSAEDFARFIEGETGNKPSEFRSLGVRTEKGMVHADEAALRPRLNEED